MTKKEHIARMILGWLLYWLVAMALPARFWATRKGWAWWAVPHIGYFVYHPVELKWWQPVPKGST